MLNGITARLNIPARNMTGQHKRGLQYGESFPLRDEPVRRSSPVLGCATVHGTPLPCP